MSSKQLCALSCLPPPHKKSNEFTNVTKNIEEEWTLTSFQDNYLSFIQLQIYELLILSAAKKSQTQNNYVFLEMLL